MKKGFTMIELIFVIVILGILAAVAIPRLAATRDDAEVAKAATNISTILSDVGAYYTSQGKFAATLSAMTNVPLINAKDLVGELGAAGNGCIKLTLTDTKDSKPAFIKVEAGTKASESICKKILALPSIKSITKNTFSYKVPKTDGTYEDKTSDPGEYAISGISVAF